MKNKKESLRNNSFCYDVETWASRRFFKCLISGLKMAGNLKRVAKGMRDLIHASHFIFNDYSVMLLSIMTYE